MPEDFFWIYVTARDEEEAIIIGRAIVEERLAACVNVLGGIRSFYWWRDRMNDDREVAMVAKTRRTLLKRLTNRIKELHSYECPCVVALPMAGGNQDFFKWLRTQTTKRQARHPQSSRRPPPIKPARKRK